MSKYEEIDYEEEEKKMQVMNKRKLDKCGIPNLCQR